MFGWNKIEFKDFKSPKEAHVHSLSYRPSSLTAGSHVIWLQSEASHSPSLRVALSVAQPLPEFTSGTKCPALGWKVPACAGRPAASILRLPGSLRSTRRASLCSALTKMHPEAAKKPHHKQNQQQSPGQGRAGGLHAGSRRSCQNRRLQIKPGEKAGEKQRKEVFHQS